MANDLGTFAKRIRAFANDVPRQVNEFKKIVAQEILTDVVPDTPVKTGLARSNYVVGIGRRNPLIRDANVFPITRNGDISLTAGFEAIRGARPGQAIHINNNLAYIGRLNDGSSTQAPAGFIERAVDRGRERARRLRLRYDASQSGNDNVG